MQRSEFEGFFIENYPRLVHSLMKYGAPLAVAEEVAQDVMAQLCRRLEDIDTPKSWVWATAHAELPGIMAKERRSVPLDGSSHAGRADPAVTEDQAATAEEKEEVLRLFQLLPDAQRQVLVLYYDGYSAVEIAQMLESSNSTVRSNLRHGRARLKKEIQI
jgi:RNA polymerase sigma factor (sigma-70 family)